jgi:hypothetical protein
LLGLNFKQEWTILLVFNVVAWGGDRTMGAVPMALEDIEIYVPPSLDRTRLRLSRAYGETKAEFKFVQDMYRRLFAEAERRREKASQ